MEPLHLRSQPHFDSRHTRCRGIAMRVVGGEGSRRTSIIFSPYFKPIQEDISPFLSYETRKNSTLFQTSTVTTPHVYASVV